MTGHEAKVGVFVRSLVDFSGVPKGTMGIIDEDYGTGIMVAWNLPDQSLPKDYMQCREKYTKLGERPLRDGFDKETELQFLELPS